jgi:hypothetical protein
MFHDHRDIAQNTSFVRKTVMLSRALVLLCFFVTWARTEGFLLVGSNKNVAPDPDAVRRRHRHQPERIHPCTDSSSRLYAFSWFNQKTKTNEVDSAALERNVLKEALIDLCRRESASRNDIDLAIQQLALFSPTKDAASSALLKKEWKL